MIINFILNLKILYYKISNYIKFKFLNIIIGENTIIKGHLFLRGRDGKISIGNNVVINSNYIENPIGSQTFTSLVVTKNAHLIIKDNVGISNSSIFCSDTIIIEEFVLIGGDCKIYDTDFHSIYINDRKSNPERGIKSAPVIIKKGAFIGTGSIILKGVEIGENVVVAAGSIVTKNIPKNELWGGNPAKFIKKIIN